MLAKPEGFLCLLWMAEDVSSNISIKFSCSNSHDNTCDRTVHLLVQYNQMTKLWFQFIEWVCNKMPEITAKTLATYLSFSFKNCLFRSRKWEITETTIVIVWHQTGYMNLNRTLLFFSYVKAAFKVKRIYNITQNWWRESNMFPKNSFCQILFKITPSKHFIAWGSTYV